MAGLRHIGGPTIRRLRDATKGVPVLVATEVARRAAPTVTALAQQNFNSGRTAYGDARPLGVRGPLSLVQSGSVRAGMRFSSLATQVRCVLPTRYAKYLVGRYWILPSVHSLPATWRRALDGVVRQVHAESAQPGARRAA
jgi:hypothetical protein